MEDVAQEVTEQKFENQESVDDSTIGGHINCPRCNWDTRQVAIPVSEDDKKEYMRSILGEGCFSKEYPLYGGRFKAKFTDLMTEESDAMVEVLNQIVEDPLFLPKAIKIKLLFSTMHYVKGDKKIDNDREALMEPKIKVEKILKLYNEFFKLPETQCGMIAKEYQDFTTLIITLAESGFDENFWKGAGRN